MKNLILIRHAKSSWDAPLIDKDRPLSKRGIDDAHLVASAVSGYLPKTFMVWSSTAQRAKNTAYIFAETLSIPIENILFKDDLYTFEVKKLENIIKSCDNKYDNLILFGHNEAITNFVNIFGSVTLDKVPTSGFVSISFEQDDWGAIQKGKTQKTVFPRELKKYDSPSHTGKPVY
ncbi:phosphohistidine phosphatase [Flavobacterium beibuense F44-8]|uniref:Phosphohistidine phosphatase n=1 Tax=Flavobacterium beibuense F44-8 TaxID=1406840 RepID=A0A0A2LT05_9FLAO|nr:histidine phosphatase family protein [Flavobacterium beibuense]KGO83467.1 phosphohistidine phosphatase [Flavobacterium beibuense F44-8]